MIVILMLLAPTLVTKLNLNIFMHVISHISFNDGMNVEKLG